MTFEMLKGKIHRATVVQAELDYVGSITVDEDLLDSAGILEYEKVSIVDINNGNRFETYTIAGERGSGMICLNGAAARCVQTGDKIIIMCYAYLFHWYFHCCVFASCQYWFLNTQKEYHGQEYNHGYFC